MALELALDCRHYLGDRPCVHRCRCRCEHYAPMGKRILIIKLAALGDVVRTACLLPTLKRIYEPCYITWVTRPNGVSILQGHPQIDRLLAFDAEGIVQLSQQQFDLVLSLDKEHAPAALCNQVLCADKRGMGLSPHGTVQPVNDACDEYFELGLDDELKFRRNAKTYPQLIHEALALPYTGEPYKLYCDEQSLARAKAQVAAWRPAGGAAVVGFNTGSGRVFANKTPHPRQWVALARRLLSGGRVVVLLGGPDEEADQQWIAQQCGPGVYLGGNHNTERQFVALVDQCDVVVTGDTLGLHVAVARSVPVVALFGPTCHQEIELYGRGRKIVSTHPCSPCYHRICDRTPSCMDALDVSGIADAVQEVLRDAGKPGPSE